MKAVGARNAQVAVLYLAMVLGYAVLSLGVALPLGAAGAYGLTVFTARLVNFDVEAFFAPPEVLALEVGVGLLVPLLAALVPVWRGVRVTVREACQQHGDRRHLRAEPGRPGDPARPRPPPPHAPVDPQHVPPQVPCC